MSFLNSNVTMRLQQVFKILYLNIFLFREENLMLDNNAKTVSNNLIEGVVSSLLKDTCNSVYK